MNGRVRDCLVLSREGLLYGEITYDKQRRLTDGGGPGTLSDNTLRPFGRGKKLPSNRRTANGSNSS